jgi:hypothetical protein
MSGLAARAEEQDFDTEGTEAGGGGDFLVVHTFDVGEP